MSDFLAAVEMDVHGVEWRARVVAIDQPRRWRGPKRIWGVEWESREDGGEWERDRRSIWAPDYRTADDAERAAVARLDRIADIRESSFYVTGVL